MNHPSNPTPNTTALAASRDRDAAGGTPMDGLPDYMREFARALDSIESAFAGLEELRGLPVPGPDCDELAMTLDAARVHTLNALGATAQELLRKENAA